MFASEQVMKQYLDQLLTEDDASIAEPAELSQPPNVGAQEFKSPHAESEYSAKIEKRFSEAEQLDKLTNPKLKPIEKAIVADKIRPVKERPKPKDNVHSLEQLLHAVSVQQQEAAKALLEKERQAVAKKVVVEPIVKTEVKAKVTPKPTVNVPEVGQTTSTAPAAKSVEKESVPVPAEVVKEEKIEEPFQALFFEVAGLKLAVPLHDLGGIHNLTEITSLFGKPEWFMGVMVNREKKLNVVESARWVMPEKYNEDLKAQLNYKYLIMLGQSNWGLAAEKLVTTQYIKPDEVKWRKQSGKRPWLFGTIKEKMCALLHVEDLVAMLDKGVDASNK